MEIVNFFETLAGKWFSQRTTHYLVNQSSQAGQSNLLIEFLPHTDPELVQMCEQGNQDPSSIACGLRINQDSRLEGESQSVKSVTLMVALHPDGAGQGIILQTTPSSPTTQGHYHLDSDVLTLTTHTAKGVVAERLWYANPNLRMRTSMLTQDDAVQMASFCSEIRMGVGPATN
ncbi:MAG: phycobiliprotein lyase [Leptolyngbya sp. LCM1.Bin17]|nr:MAG: phycobiliprotein lyase [Leptolyngbya sp. LCM1.Bin17]